MSSSFSNKKFPLADLLRQSVYSRLAGYEDLSDAVRVSADPTFRLIGSKKNWDRGGALTSRLQSFEAELLASDENLLGLMTVNRELVAQAATQDDSERVVLDMDSTESPVHGQQEGSAYNGRLPPFVRGIHVQEIPDDGSREWKDLQARAAKAAVHVGGRHI